MSEVDLLSPPDASAVTRGIARFACVAKERYGNGLKALYLFGSRARGDFSPFSDIDLAIVVDDSIDTSSETVPLSEAAYDVLVETGAEVQPWVFHESDWGNPAKSSSPGLLRSATRDAVLIGIGQ